MDILWGKIISITRSRRSVSESTLYLFDDYKHPLLVLQKYLIHVALFCAYFAIENEAPTCMPKLTLDLPRLLCLSRVFLQKFMKKSIKYVVYILRNLDSQWDGALLGSNSCLINGFHSSSCKCLWTTNPLFWSCLFHLIDMVISFTPDCININS